MMGAGLAADFHAARARFAQNADAAGGADVLTVDMVIAEFREKNVPHHDRFLSGAGQPGNPSSVLQ